MTELTRRTSYAIPFVLIGAFGVACGGGNSNQSPPGSTTDKVPAGVVKGTVTYAGTKTGSLIVGLYQTCPPAGPPYEMVMTKIDTPTFPQAFEIKNVKQTGKFRVAAIFDIGSNNPTQPGPEDLVECSDEFTLTADEGVKTTITLADKATVPAGKIIGTISYAGTQTGSLVVGLYQSCPPLGPPYNMIAATFTDPVFPQDFELKDITDTGKFRVVAIYDIGKNNPMSPGAEDLVECSSEFELTATEGAKIDVTLVDK